MPALPSGTVTFLFTDVEGSTRLLEQHPVPYREAIVRHHAILRDAVEKNRGAVFETIGDAVYAVFSSPSDAVCAALRAQLDLGTAPWGELGSLKVRMGLHTGEAELQGDHYFGAALYRCARLMSAAHGGQVVLSSIAADLMRETLPAAVDLHDLGEYRLKDLQRAERIFQLRSPGLATDFPPLRTLGDVPNNLPLALTPFIGREQVVAATRGLLARPVTRLVTLTGPGGIGKTRLSLQVAADSLHEYRSGVFFVELAHIMAPDLVMPTIAKILSVQETANRPILDSVKEYLKEKELLLVLDNFEHIITAAAQIADLLSACPRVKTLVTSREALRVRGEQQFPVPPLALPDRSRVEPVEQLARYEAVRLFIERAQVVKMEFSISEGNAYAIAEICRRLDGLPLAIELAAARINVFSPQAMLARLEQKLAVLTGGLRDLPARQQTLRETIAWSYDLLTPAEQTVHRRLAVFAGGCILAAAETVVGATLPAHGAPRLDVFARLVSLVDKSLLRQVSGMEEPRFRMLETIREYALERLTEAGETDEFAARHADFYLALTEQAEPGLIGAHQAAWLDRLEEEHDNLRAALRWLTRAGPVDHGLRLAATLRGFWRARGYITEGRERMAELLSLAAAQTRDASRAKALHAAGWLAREQGDYGPARALFEESLDIYRQLGDARGIGWALVDLGFLTRYEGNYLVAAPMLEESLVLLRQTGDTEGTAAALGNLGLIARDQGDAEGAEERLEESLALWRELGNRVGSGWVLTALGMVAQAQGRSDIARGRLQESLSVWRELNDRHSTANLLSTLARLACDQGEAGVARAHLRESLAIFMEVGDRRGIAFVLEGFARLAAAEGQPIRTIYLAAAAAGLRRIIGAPAPPAWRDDVERSMDVARAVLSPEALEAALARGQALTFREAVAFAQEDATSDPTLGPTGHGP